MGLLNRPAQWLYRFWEKKRPVVSVGVRRDLERLHPGEDLQQVCRRYAVTKLEKSMTIILAGAVLAAAVSVHVQGERAIEDNRLDRAEVSEEGETVLLETVLEGDSERFEILVMPARMDTGELEQCYEDFKLKLPELIKGSNSSLQEVVSNLSLEESYEGYPFEVEWKSNMGDIVSSSGEVTPCEADYAVTVKARVTYGDREWEEVISLFVPSVDLSSREVRHKELEKQLVSSQEETQTEKYWSLPSNWEGKTLRWERVVEDNSMLLWIGAFLVGVVIYFLQDRDLHREIEKRREQMKGKYPDIVHKLVLYLGAGMTLQGTFQRLAAEYEERRIAGVEAEPIYEEIVYTCRELKSGVSESVAYERFGKRTGLQEYVRLSTLMVQNLKKGNSSLVTRLGEEADRALVERIQKGRKLGEEASTKLLLPMVMMLAVVMVMIMLPAFGSMGL